jgi:hypothetical protein
MKTRSREMRRSREVSIPGVSPQESERERVEQVSSDELEKWSMKRDEHYR